MTERTFGWVQDPGKIENLRKVVEVFDSKSKTHLELKTITIPKLVSEEDGKSHLIAELNKEPLVLKYKDLVGTGFTPRASARCNGIIQATIKGQRRPYIADWPADNFIRWAQSLGFVKWDKESDSFSITELGTLLSRSEKDSDDEYNIFEQAFLSYPPVSRVLKLLVNAGQNGESLTKFEIGKQLGFIGEEGFTSVSQSLFVKEISIASKEEKKDINSNWEGDSDKYARMICGWLTQLKYPWVERVEKNVSVKFGNQDFSEELRAYIITRKGFEIRKKLDGSSKFKRIAKMVNFEMLSTKGKDRQYLRTRRAHILNFISGKRLSSEEIQKKLEEKGMNETLLAIQDDIKGLENIGLNVDSSMGKYFCSDEIIGLEIPALKLEETQKSEIQDLIEKCRVELGSVPHEYLVLIGLSFDKNQSKMFEIKTMELLTEHCAFEGLHLGGSNKPDGLIYNTNYGVIIDTKSYAEGFNIPAPERDKMKRYVDENQERNSAHNKTQWWNNFPSTLQDFMFLFVSGKFGGNFKEQLKILSERTNNTLGAVMTSYTLLRLADQLIDGTMNHQEFQKKLSCLEEVSV